MCSISAPNDRPRTLPVLFMLVFLACGDVCAQAPTPISRATVLLEHNRQIGIHRHQQAPYRNPSLGIDKSDSQGGVFLHSGEVVLSRTDLKVRGRDLGFSFTRTYRSGRDGLGPLGHGWDANVFMHLREFSNGIIRCFDGTGRRDDYRPEGGGAYRSPNGFYTSLTKNVGGYLLRNRDGTRYTFDLSGRLTSTRNRRGNQTTYVFGGGSHPVQAFDEFGRVTTFTYSPGGLLERITDFTGREVRFSYDSSDNLTEVRSPLVTGTPNGNDFPQGKRERYTYDNSNSDPRLAHNLLEVIAPNEVEDGSLTPRIVNVYGRTGRNYDCLVRQTVGGTNGTGADAGGTLSFAYAFRPSSVHALPLRLTTVTDRIGNVTDYYHDRAGRAVRVVEGPAGPTPFVTQFEHDVDGQVVRKVLPMGNEVQYVFDSVNPDRFQQGNLLETINIPDAARGGDQVQLQTSYSYEPLYNQVRTVTEARGNDQTYVPQNGGASSPARYTTTFVFDYQEAQGAPLEANEFGILIPGNLLNLGDVNGDGRTDQVMGNLISRESPTVKLLPGSQQAAVEGDPDQAIVTGYVFNDFGQLVERVDARGNRDTFEYYPESDPDGDGQDVIQANDPTTGGYLSKSTVDALFGQSRQDTAPLTQLATCYAYDARGNVTSKTDGRGEAYSFTHNALDQVVQLELPRVHPGQATGFQRRRSYDANDNVVALEVQNWKPDSNGVPQLDAGHPFFEHRTTYDILDNVLTQTQDASRDPIIPPSPESESLVTRYVYDSNENVVMRRSPLAEDGTDPNHVETYVYDERDQMISETRGDGSNEASTTGFGYDPNGNQTSYTDAEDNDHVPGPERATYVYDGFDRLIAIVDRVGNESRITYDPNSRVVEQERSGPVDGSASASTALERTHFLFDELGRLIQEDRELFLPGGVTVANPVSLTEGPLTPADGRLSERFEYDALDRLTFRLEDGGAVYSREYDGANRMIRSTQPIVDLVANVQRDRIVTYDANGNVTKEVQTLVSPESHVPPKVLTTLFVYDALDRLARITDTAGSTIYRQHDSRDNVLSTTDSRATLIADPLGLYTAGMINGPGNPKRYAYDGIGRLWLRQQGLHQAGQGDGPVDTSNPAIPGGLIEQVYAYDANGRSVAITDGNGNTVAVQYDSLDRQTSLTNADGGMRILTYDSDDNVTAYLDENGTVHSMTYDALDRRVGHDLVLPSTIIPGAGLPMLIGTTSQTYEYDGLSRLTRSLDNNEPGDPSDDWEVRTIYDSLSRIVEQNQNGSPVSSSFEGNRRSELFYPRANRVLQFVRDEHHQIVSVVDPGRLAIVTNYLGDEPTPIFRESTVFNPAAVIALTCLVQLDDVLRVEASQDTALVSGLIAQQSVLRDRNHALVQQQLSLQNGLSGFMNLVFDWGLTSLQQIATHDRQQDVNGTLTQTFYEFRYGPGQEILEVTDGVLPVQTNSFDPTYERTNGPFEYDGGQASGSGLRTQDGNYYYQWDGLGRLQTVSPVGSPLSPIAQYDYDAEPFVQGGRRVEKDVQNTGSFDGITRFYYDEAHVIEETSVVGPAEDVSRQFIYGYRGPDDIVAMDVDTNADGGLDALFFYVRDANHNTTCLVDENGNVVEFYAYNHLACPEIFDSSANPLGSSPSGNPYLFTGRRYEPETGLYQYRARYFDPANGEFLSRDPLGFWGDRRNDGNPMTYVGNDLWNVRDASGLMGTPWPEYFVGVAQSAAPMGGVWQTADGPSGIESNWYGYQSIAQAPVHEPCEPVKDLHAGFAAMGLDASTLAGGGGGTKQLNPPPVPTPYPCDGEGEAPAAVPKTDGSGGPDPEGSSGGVGGVTSGNFGGGVTFNTWSFDIKVEGKCIVNAAGALFEPPFGGGGLGDLIIDELEPAPLGVAPPFGGVIGPLLLHDDFVRF